MADAGGGVSKGAAKSAKTDAGKAAKKRPDPEGLKLIEAGDAAMAAKDFAKAVELFEAAKAKCESSTVTAEKKPKEPKAPKEPKPPKAAKHLFQSKPDGKKQTSMMSFFSKKA